LRPTLAGKEKKSKKTIFYCKFEFYQLKKITWLAEMKNNNKLSKKYESKIKNKINFKKGKRNKKEDLKKFSSFLLNFYYHPTTNPLLEFQIKSKQI